METVNVLASMAKFFSVDVMDVVRHKLSRNGLFHRLIKL